MGDRGFKPTPLGEILSPRPAAIRNMFHWHGRPGEVKPLWAILGEEPPYDWRPPEARDSGVMELATAEEGGGEPGGGVNPDAGRPRAPGVYVTAHRISGAGPIHTAIEYVSENGDREWIGAGPDFHTGHLVSGVGMQEKEGEARGERPSDAPESNVAVERLTPPEGMTSTDLWGEIKRRKANYRDRLDYDLFPEIQDGYNSNSYTRGILDASGGTYTVPFDDYVGGKDPVPPVYFDPPHIQEGGVWGSFNSPHPYRRRLPRTRY